MGMDMYQKLTRALMRRKYERIGMGRMGDVKVPKPVTVKVPKAEKGKDVEVDPLPVLVPKRFTILSSSNDVIDEDWFNTALRRTLAEGKLNIIKPRPVQD